MAQMTLSDLAGKMKDIDIAVMTTRMAGGQLAGRPMSNNGDVEYKGESYYFTYEDTHTVEDIERDAHVGLAFQGSPTLFKGPTKFYVFVEGNATLIRDKSAFKAHWTKDVEKWFENGIDTPGIVLIKVVAERIKWWNGTENGEVPIS